MGGGVDSLATAMLRLAEDPTRRKAWGEAGRARFTDQFRHETMTAALRRIYQEVLEEKSPASPSQLRSTLWR